MRDDLVEAVAATIACNSPSGLQYPWHRVAALAIVVEVIERCANVAESVVIPCDVGGGVLVDPYSGECIAAAIRKLGESE